ncbi:MAG: hypothetical protein ACOYI5_08395 [Christensenellales bacterium]|jgi:hypothetical protein
MAGSIIHLLAARAWARERPELADCPEFYLGAIAPDAVHVRAGVGKAEKQATHLGNHGKFDVKPLADYARTRKSAFDVGYLVHLLTDPFWVAAYKQLPGLLKADGHTNPDVYYPEMERTERALLDPALLAMLKAARAPGDHPLFTANEIAAWRDRTVAHYLAIAGDGRTSAHLTVSFVNAFVARAGAYLSDMMRRFDP